MKKILLFILFMPFISFSQFNYGVKGSFILANLKSSDNVTVDTKAKPSYSIGAFTEYKFNSIALELSVSFLDAGAKGEASQRSSFDDIAEYGDFKYSLKSIFIELLGKYYITEKINFKAGPYMGIITSAEYDIPNQDLNDFWKKK